MAEKTRWVHVRCSPEEQRLVRTLAAERGQNMSEAVRHAIKSEAQRLQEKREGGNNNET